MQARGVRDKGQVAHMIMEITELNKNKTPSKGVKILRKLTAREHAHSAT